MAASHEWYSSKQCKSGIYHDWAIEDGVVHYFGCLRFKDRAAFFNDLRDDDKLKKAIAEEENRIFELRNVFEKEGLKTDNGRLLYKLKVAVSQKFRRPPPPPPTSSVNESAPVSSDPEEDDVDLKGLNANIMYYKDGRPYDHPDFDGTFPNQKVPLNLLLKQDRRRNPLMWRCEENMIRYFHVPANNMVRISSDSRFYAFRVVISSIPLKCLINTD